MTAEGTLRDLLLFMGTARSASFLMGAESEDEAETEPIVQRVTLKKELATEFVDDAKSLVAEAAEDPVLLPYDPGYKPSVHELCYVHLGSEMKLVKSIIEDISMVDQAEIFEEDEGFIGSLRFYAIIVEGKSERAIFFHSYSPEEGADSKSLDDSARL